MDKTNDVAQVYKIAVDIKGLMNLLSVGRHTAERIGVDADARFKVGKRTLYNVRKVQEYIDTL